MRKKKKLNLSEEEIDKKVNDIVKQYSPEKNLKSENLFFTDFFKSMFKTFGYTLLAFIGLLLLLFLIIWLRG
ncbi:MAG: hypothetical protein ACOC3Z_01955 [Nanoarchaeota archaeon]